jgi:hypothetical protein
MDNLLVVYVGALDYTNLSGNICYSQTHQLIMLLKVLHKKCQKQQKHSELNFELTRVEHVKSS